MDTIIDRIKEQRKKKGFSHENMAHELNISQAAYSKIEKNETRLTVDRLFEIANILEVSVSELLEGNASRTYNQHQHEFHDYSLGVGHQEVENQNIYQENKEILDKLLITKDEIISKQQEEIGFLRSLLKEKK